jgi:hypothetical protein
MHSIAELYPAGQEENRMRVFKVYDPDEADHQLILATSPSQAAGIARTVWAEGGTPQHHVKVVELRLPEGDVGLIYEPNTTPVEYPKTGRRKG